MDYFWLKRFHSLTGLWLAIFYVICFLLPYSAILGGHESFDIIAMIRAKVPLVGTLRFVFVFIPLLFHAIFGLALIYTSEINVISYGTYKNWMYALQRLSAVIIIPFIAYHVYRTEIVFAFTGKYADYAYMSALVSEPWVKAIYLTGIFAASFHAGGGIATALFRWGVTVSRRSQDVAAMAMWAVTFVFAVWGFLVVNSF